MVTSVTVAAAFFVFIRVVLFANSLLRHSYCFVYLSCFRAIYILLGFLCIISLCFLVLFA